jgi:hypothetical protein
MLLTVCQRGIPSLYIFSTLWTTNRSPPFLRIHRIEDWSGILLIRQNEKPRDCLKNPLSQKTYANNCVRPAPDPQDCMDFRARKQAPSSQRWVRASARDPFSHGRTSCCRQPATRSARGRGDVRGSFGRARRPVSAKWVAQAQSHGLRPVQTSCLIRDNQ